MIKMMMMMMMMIIIIIILSGSLGGRIASQQLQDHTGMSRKEYLKARCFELAFGWQCCRCWVVFARYIELFITDAFVDMFITICIVVNTIFMALDHAGMSAEMAHTLQMGNYVSHIITGWPKKVSHSQMIE